MPKRKNSKSPSESPELWGLEPRVIPPASIAIPPGSLPGGVEFPPPVTKRKGDRLEQLEWALDKANKRARLYEMSFMSVKRSELRLVAMLLDLKVPAEKLAEWQIALDHIEAIKMNGMSRVKSVVLDAALSDGDVNQE